MKKILVLVTCLFMLFTFTACGETVTESEEENIEVAEEQDEGLSSDDIKEMGFEEPSYEDVRRHPENYIEKKVVMSGRVIQVFGEQEEEVNVLRMDVGSGDYVLVQYKTALTNEVPIEDDYVSAWGTFNLIEKDDKDYPMIDIKDADTDELYIDLEE